MNVGKKSWFFHTPLHSMPLFWGFPSEYCHPVWYGKTRMVGLTNDKKILSICITVYTQYWRVTDRRTDGQTDILPRHSPRYTYASHGKNLVVRIWNHFAVKKRTVGKTYWQFGKVGAPCKFVTFGGDNAKNLHCVHSAETGLLTKFVMELRRTAAHHW